MTQPTTKLGRTPPFWAVFTVLALVPVRDPVGLLVLLQVLILALEWAQPLVPALAPAPVRLLVLVRYGTGIPQGIPQPRRRDAKLALAAA